MKNLLLVSCMLFNTGFISVIRSQSVDIDEKGWIQDKR